MCNRHVQVTPVKCDLRYIGQSGQFDTRLTERKRTVSNETVESQLARHVSVECNNCEPKCERASVITSDKYPENRSALEIFNIFITSNCTSNTSLSLSSATPRFLGVWRSLVFFVTCGFCFFSPLLYAYLQFLWLKVKLGLWLHCGVEVFRSLVVGFLPYAKYYYQLACTLYPCFLLRYFVYHSNSFWKYFPILFLFHTRASTHAWNQHLSTLPRKRASGFLPSKLYTALTCLVNSDFAI